MTDPTGLADIDDAYANPGGSATDDPSDAIDLEEKWWNDLKGGMNEALKHKSSWDAATTKRNHYINNRILIALNLERFKNAADSADCCICPEWLIAIWWDERARMEPDERLIDDTGDAAGADTSTGPFQMKGSAAKEVIKNSGNYTKAYQRMSADALQDAMQKNFDLAAVLAADRMCQIMIGYDHGGWQPCEKGALSAIELVGTLYSQGMGSPKANPKANDRGRQIAKWAKEAKEWLNLPDCECWCNEK